VLRPPAEAPIFWFTQCGGTGPAGYGGGAAG
jgi:hypothetical protein